MTSNLLQDCIYCIALNFIESHLMISLQYIIIIIISLHYMHAKSRDYRFYVLSFDLFYTDLLMV